MRFWFVHSGEVSLREQIVQQVSLGVLSGELAAGERLPSIRELARRFRIHSNTVSAAYRELHAAGWVQMRRGSGVYVSAPVGARGVRGVGVVEHLLARAVAAGRALGLSDEEVRERLDGVLRPAGRLVLVEADAELARIVVFEIVAAGSKAPEVCGLEVEAFGAELRGRLGGAVAVVMPSKVAAARAVVGEAGVLVLGISPVARSLAENLPVSREHLVGVASHWPRFLEIGRGMLISAGFSADALVVRDAREAGWLAGLETAAAVVCDRLTAGELPQGVNGVVFPLVAEESLRQYVEMAERMGAEEDGRHTPGAKAPERRSDRDTLG